MRNSCFAVLVVLVVWFGAGCSTIGHPGRTGSSDAAAYFEQGSAAFKEKAYERAVDDLQRALALRPEYPEALNLLGMVYFFEKDYATAEAKFQKAIAVDPAFAFAYTNLGNLYFMTGRLDKSEDYLKKAIAISPRLVSAYYSLGNLYLATGRSEEATAYLSKGLELDPTYYETHLQFIATPAGQDAAEFNFAWARVYASKSDIANTVKYLEAARRAGFRDWKRIESDKTFDSVRENPDIKKFIKS